MADVFISTDGSGMASGGPGGWAAVLRCGDKVREISGMEREATNNTMEIMAAIKALQALRRPCSVEITTDSEYLKFGAERWLNGWKRFGWKTREGEPVQNRELWMELDAQLERHDVTWKHTPGHAGHVDNERCDVLAGIQRRKAADILAGIDTGAIFSDDRLYRYCLWRIWNPDTHKREKPASIWGPYTPWPRPPRIVNFLMLNPSTADEIVNDPTVERCERRARSWGYDGLCVTNIFAIRATDPEVLKTAADPVGPQNDDAIAVAAGESALVVCAWGVHGELNGRSAAVRDLLKDIPLHVLKLTKEGHPAHPLYLPYKLQPVEWKV